jgi:hypothetical protein
MDNVTEHRAIVDTHRHPIGTKLAAKMAERGFYDPKQEFPQTNAQDLIGYREFYDLTDPPRLGLLLTKNR